jgi:large subunit ribosomal protein L9
MDVVLLKDVEKLGAEGAVVKVKPGFARNYLLPRGLAVRASAERVQQVEAAQRRRQEQGQRARAGAEALRTQIEGRAIRLTLNVGDDGHPFGSVSVHDLIEALAREGFTVEKHQIQLEQPIKTLGVFDVAVRLHPDVTATVKVSVAKA